jgi:hypothetical protein
VQFFSGPQAKVFKDAVLPQLARRKSQTPMMAFLGDTHGHNAALVHAMLLSSEKTRAQSAQSQFMLVHKRCQLPFLGYKTDQTNFPDGIELHAIRAPGGGYIIPLPDRFVKRAVVINSEPCDAYRLKELGVNVMFSCGCIIPPNYTKPGPAAIAKGEQVIAKAAEFLPKWGFLITPPPHSAMAYALSKHFREIHHESMGPVVYRKA